MSLAVRAGRHGPRSVDHMRVAVAVRRQQDVARVPPEWSVAAPLEGAVAPARRLAPRNSTTSEDANARRFAAPPTPTAHSPASQSALAPSAAARRGSPRRCPARGRSKGAAGNVGVRRALLLCEVGDGPCLPAQSAAASDASGLDDPVADVEPERAADAPAAGVLGRRPEGPRAVPEVPLVGIGHHTAKWNFPAFLRQSGALNLRERRSIAPVLSGLVDAPAESAHARASTDRACGAAELHMLIVPG